MGAGKSPQASRASKQQRATRGVKKFTPAEISAIWFFLVLQFVVLVYFQLILDHGAIFSLQKTAILKEGFFSATSTPGSSTTKALSEREQALAYVQSFKSLGRRLSFFHIPKTAGTAVEQVAAENGIPWGSCAFKHVPKRKICPYPSGEDWPKNVGWWHVPRHFFPLGNSDPYHGSELFGIIRDPFDRMVSEFYYLCTLKVKEWRPSQCDRDRLTDADYMNSWLAHKLQNKHGSLALSYLMDNSHFTPHYDYIMGPNNVRMIDYVLRLDDPTQFQQDFQKLMKAFDLPLELRQMQSISSHGEYENSTSTMLTKQDLTNTSTFWIRKKFAHDIEKLGLDSMNEVS